MPPSTKCPPPSPEPVIAPDPSPAAPQNSPKHPIGENSLNDASDRLSPKQRVAIELLLTGKSLSQVAADCGVDRKTLYAWRSQNPDFAAALRGRLRELWGDSSDQLRALLPRALDVLARQLDDRYDRARVDAAKTILRLVDIKSVVSLAPDDDVDD